MCNLKKMVQLIPWLEASSGFLFTNHKRALTGTQQVILAPEMKKVLNPVAPLKEHKGSAGGHTLPDLFQRYYLSTDVSYYAISDPSLCLLISLVFQSKQRAREKQLKNRTWKALLHNPVGHYKHFLPLKRSNCSLLFIYFFTLTMLE